jgi:hypothetical protein
MQVIDYDKYIVNDDRVKFFVKSKTEPAPLAGHGDEDFGFQVIKNSIRQVFTDTIVAPGELALFVVILLLRMSVIAPRWFAIVFNSFAGDECDRSTLVYNSFYSFAVDECDRTMPVCNSF